MEMYTISYYWAGNVLEEQVLAADIREAAVKLVKMVHQKYSWIERAQALFRVVNAAQPV